MVLINISKSCLVTTYKINASIAYKYSTINGGTHVIWPRNFPQYNGGQNVGILCFTISGCRTNFKTISSSFKYSKYRFIWSRRFQISDENSRSSFIHGVWCGFLFESKDFNFQTKIWDQFSFMGFDVKHTVGIDFCHLLIFDILCNFRIKWFMILFPRF